MPVGIAQDHGAVAVELVGRWLQKFRTSRNHLFGERVDVVEEDVQSHRGTSDVADDHGGRT
ncbi:hypothetical protein [Saccharopolyspora sp. NPDC002686]|uniref:hypothetical protein n=1 Tax=Saccharopolyspora sp. NPDC002686 TaxID=3154541 RepID=UPI00332B3C9A